MIGWQGDIDAALPPLGEETQRDGSTPPRCMKVGYGAGYMFVAELSAFYRLDPSPAIAGLEGPQLMPWWGGRPCSTSA